MSQQNTTICVLVHRVMYGIALNATDDWKGLQSYWVQGKQDKGIIAALHYVTKFWQVKGKGT